MSVIAEQIIGRKKSREKLPTFYHADAIIYPPGLNLEQCSSEETARFKSSYVLASLKQKALCADLTGGFGVDTFFFSKIFQQVYYIEPNLDLLGIARHNHQQLGAKTIRHYNTTAQEFLKSCEEVFDCLYIDPSRRDNINRKVFSFSDCIPDVTMLSRDIFEKTNYLLVKASPLLDIQNGLKDLIYTKHIFVISVENECKEVLYFCDRSFDGEPTIEAINLLKGSSFNTFSFLPSEEKGSKVTYSEPLTYLYEPNASILKAGAFKLISTRLTVEKLHPSTHLYTSDNLVKSFPGKVFKIIAHVKAASNALQEFFPHGQANVSTRNYPLSVKELRKKTGLKDGGDNYLIGFSGIQKKFLVAAERLI